MARTKLVLGTVQLGMTYGLNNTHGMPTSEEAFAILDAALKGGIDTFDTAAAYGTSEDVLGAWMSTRKNASAVKIISKMKAHVLNDYPDGTAAAHVVRTELEKSLTRLGLESLDGYLLHSPYYIYMTHVVDGLRQAKEAGLVGNIGVSIYDEAEALQAVRLGVDYVQVPYNVFDQRLDKTDFFEVAKKNDTVVFARSPFLQGLLLMEPAAIPAHLAYARPFIERFRDIAARHGKTPAEAALLLVRSSRADHIVFGVETLSQLEKGLAAMKMTDDSVAEELKNSFEDMPRSIVNPSLWSTIKP